MPSVPRWVCLLAVCWVTVQCGAGQDAAQGDVQAAVQEHTQQTIQSGSPADQGTDLSSTLDLLWTVVDRAVKSAVEPLITELNIRLDTVQTQLNSQNTELLIRLGGLQNELNSVKSQLNSQNTDVTTQLKRVQTQLENKTDNMKTELTAQNTELNTRLDTVQSDLVSHLDRVQSELDTMQTQLNSQNTDVTAQLKGAQTQLETQMDNMKTELTVQNAELNTSLNTIQTQLNSQNIELNTSLNTIQTQLNSQNIELTSRLDSIQTNLHSRPDSVQSDLLTALMSIRDCSDLPAGTASGIHTLQPGHNRSMLAYCDMETDGGGWTVIQRRGDIQPRRDFYLDWDAYKEGFGELNAEFWWGLENMWRTTSMTTRHYELRIELEDFNDEKRKAVYQGFRLSSEADDYRLTASSYKGNAGDSLHIHSGARFSTKDRDQDTYSGNCAQLYKGAWWYTACHHANLNGLYLSGQHSSYADGINWHAWKGHHYSLKTVEMKIRPS